jgi:hypothetical protein
VRRPDRSPPETRVPRIREVAVSGDRFECMVVTIRRDCCAAIRLTDGSPARNSPGRALPRCYGCAIGGSTADRRARGRRADAPAKPLHRQGPDRRARVASAKALGSRGIRRSQRVVADR